jgi:hypothetical protein
VLDNTAAMREARPVLDPDLYNNRSADNAATLLMIAETLGANCAKQARAAIKALTRGDIIDANGMLLGDIATMLTDPEIKVGDPPAPVGDKDFLLSSDLCALLREYFPHRELYAAFTQAKLASMLSNFDIVPEQRRHASRVLRGYRRKSFDEWLIRYGFVDPAAEPMTAVIDPVKGTDEVATPLPPESSEQEPLAQTTAPQIVYAKARVVEPDKGDKKRGDRLRAAVDTAIQDGDAEPDTVQFISARFWVIQRDGKPCFVHLNRGCLEWCPIGKAGLLFEDGVVWINPEKSRRSTVIDRPLMDRLVNAYRKIADSPT